MSKRPLHQGLFEDNYRSRNVYDLKPQDLDRLDPANPQTEDPDVELVDPWA
ncbi:hypothetical protein AB0O42_35675 [Streptomyces sp. NPDC089922]|uniref:hypothetical protein n=1 Tax=Streptomyces sp. NPDC089922 TaxID=3155189 RepID=UPI00341FE801